MTSRSDHPPLAPPIEAEMDRAFLDAKPPVVQQRVEGLSLEFLKRVYPSAVPDAVWDADNDCA